MGDIFPTHAGHRLVQQQNLRIERQRGGDFENPLATVRQIGRKRVFSLIRPTMAISSSARAFSLSSEESGSQNCVARLLGRCNATRTFSRTVRCGNTADI
jgi:hypothetical protein